MLRFLLDAHVDPAVAREVPRHRSDCEIHALRSWRGGVFLHRPDEEILAAATEAGLTLVTYDLQSIPSILKSWEGHRSHAGVIYIDNRSIRQNDVGGIVRGLTRVWDTTRRQDWTNVIDFLAPVTVME